MKKVKFILPLVAIVFAVAGVFATGNSAVINDNVTLGYLNSTPNCTVDGQCTNPAEGSACTTSSGLILRVRAGLSSCSVDAKGVWTSDH